MSEHDYEHGRPNVADPMSEPSRHRRVWAAYLHRGYTRASFAKALGSTWSVVQAWDEGRATISLQMLERVRDVLGFSLEQLCFGSRAMAAAGSEPVLDAAGMQSALRECNASVHARAAFAAHTQTLEGQLQDITRSYVHAWIAGWQARSDQEDAAEHALITAVNARAVTNAVGSAREPLDLTREDVSPSVREREVRSAISSSTPLAKTRGRPPRRRA